VAVVAKQEKRQLGDKVYEHSRLLGYLCFPFLMYEINAYSKGEWKSIISLTNWIPKYDDLVT
jgi:hypothetical protein